MTKASEPEVREMLKRRAGDFSISPGLPPTVLRRARRRRSVAAAVTGGFAMILGAATWFGLANVRAPSPEVSGGSGSSPQSVRMVSYLLPDTANHPHDPSEPGHEVTEHELRAHAECMRDQGFNVPDPTQSDGGWGIIIDDPQAQGLDLNSPAFREAMMVTCGPLGGPLTGNLVISGSRQKIDQFTFCMQAEGFELPQPANHHGDWEFDLAQTDIDTSLPEWNRALFVTCAPNDV